MIQIVCSAATSEVERGAACCHMYRGTQVPKYCPEDELTRDMLLGYLKAKGEIEEVRQVEVTVQMMDGSTFGEPSPWNAI